MSENPSRPLSLFIILLSLSLFYLYGSVLWGKEVLFYRDIAHTYYPFHTFLKASVWQGDWPWWNPYSFMGIPQIAAAEPAFFYPGTWLFFFFDFQSALVLNLWLHHFVMGLGMFFLLRLYAWHETAQIGGALLFSLSGYMISMNNLHPLFFSYAWCSVLFALVHLHFQRANTKTLMGIALVYALQLLSGHLEVVFYTSLLLLGYVSLHVEKQKWKALCQFFCALGLGLLLAAPQFIPSLEYFYYSVRAEGLPLAMAQDWSLHPLRLLSVLIPEFLGDLFAGTGLIIFGDPRHGYAYLMNDLYFGGLSIALILVGVKAWGPSKYGLFWLCCFILCLFLSLGYHSPVHGLFYAYFPGFSSFRYPIKFFFFCCLSLSLFASAGLHAVFTSEKPLKKTFYVVLGGVLCLWLALFLSDTWQAKFYEFILQSGAKLEQGTYIAWLEHYLRHLRVQLLWVSALIIVAILILYWGKKKDMQRASWGLLAVILLDLGLSAKTWVWTHSSDYFQQTPEVHDIFETLPKESLRYVEAGPMQLSVPAAFQQYQGQMIGSEFLHQGGLMSFHMLGPYPHIFPEWPPKPAKLSRLHQVYAQQISQNPQFRFRFESLSSAQYIYDINSVLPVRDFMQNNSQNYELIQFFPRLNAMLWKNKRAQARAHFKYQSLAFTDEEKLYQVLVEPQSGFDPQQHVLLLQDQAYEQALKNIPKAEAQEKKWSQPQLHILGNNQLNIHIETNTSGYLVLADNYYPGWKAYDNGVETPILKANYFQKAVRLGPGQHHLSFVYEAAVIKWGFGCALLGLFIMGALGFRELKYQV